MKRKAVLIAALLIVAVFAIGCGPRTTTPLTPQHQAEKNAATWLHIWNSQFDDHVAMSKMPNLTDAQKKILNRKADLLSQSKPLLDTYVAAVKGGITPASSTEQQLMLLMNQLSQMALSFT
jgi:hypothetical protein